MFAPRGERFLTDRLEGMLQSRDEALLRQALPRSSAS
jgi:hypothetical protein